MPNAFITLLDSGKDITPKTVIESLSQVPFLKHQFKWCVQKFAESPDHRMICGYTGVKKITPKRTAALDKVGSVLQGLARNHPSEIEKIPDAIDWRNNATFTYTGPDEVKTPDSVSMPSPINLAPASGASDSKQRLFS